MLGNQCYDEYKTIQLYSCNLCRKYVARQLIRNSCTCIVVGHLCQKYNNNKIRRKSFVLNPLTFCTQVDVQQYSSFGKNLRFCNSVDYTKSTKLFCFKTFQYVYSNQLAIATQLAICILQRAFAIYGYAHFLYLYTATQKMKKTI